LKDTPELRDWVNEQVNKYYKQIGVNTLPKICFNFDELPHNLHCECHTKLFRKSAGMGFVSNGKKPHVLLLNIKYHKSYRDLEDTIAHEMMHIRFPNLNHNDEFDPSRDFYTRLGMILQGKHYPKSVRKKRRISK